MMRFLPVNLDALLVELDDLAQTLALHASLRDEPVYGIEELVPAARTLLVRFRPEAVAPAALVARISARRLSGAPERNATLIEIPVDYSGEDILEVAQLLGISRDDVVRRHTGREYTVAFTGFAPGFAYMSNGTADLNVPRRSTPRTRIPAGAVGLAGEFTGIYPQASPGGWQLIGVTAIPMWDLMREVPALLQPGFRVRFIDVTGQSINPPPARSKPTLPLPPPTRQVDASLSSATRQGDALEVLSIGLQALFQDEGRRNQAKQGVGASGAMDFGALHAANRLVGNVGNVGEASGAPCIETVGGGLRLLCHGDAVVAITGADAPVQLTTAGGICCTVQSYEAMALSDGDQLFLGEPRAGARSYLAVRGGFTVDAVLGSCATDTLARLGPAPLAVGDTLEIRPVTRGAVVGAPELAPGNMPCLQHTVTLDVVMGPRTDWFTPDAVEQFAQQVWTVTPQSNRVGLRLAGDTPLQRIHTAELPSEGTVRGAIQVPPSGQPVLFMADHPLTGGYPVIGAVAPYHLDRAGQIPIGAQVRFNLLHMFNTL